eukprot:Pompholyxophrys_punicea_v1_NODE_137_length_3263_cov_59.617207.p1 type:complete len:502 gc:universal NODE_137_length_3263_cov_59.617207:2439-934(-)
MDEWADLEKNTSQALEDISQLADLEAEIKFQKKEEEQIQWSGVDSAVVSALSELEKVDNTWYERKKTIYTSWINSHLFHKEEPPITRETIISDLSDGVKIIVLVESLTRTPFSYYERRPTERAQVISNWNFVINYLRRTLDLKIFFQIENFVDKNEETFMTLLDFLFAKDNIDLERLTKKATQEGLLLWTKEILSKKYSQLAVSNYSETFRTGLVWLALIELYVNDSETFNYELYSSFSERVFENVNSSFEEGLKFLKVPVVLNVYSVLSGEADLVSMVWVLSCYFRAFMLQKAQKVENQNWKIEDTKEELKKYENLYLSTTKDFAYTGPTLITHLEESDPKWIEAQKLFYPLWINSFYPSAEIPLTSVSIISEMSKCSKLLNFVEIVSGVQLPFDVGEILQKQRPTSVVLDDDLPNLELDLGDYLKKVEMVQKTLTFCRSTLALLIPDNIDAAKILNENPAAVLSVLTALFRRYYIPPDADVQTGGEFVFFFFFFFFFFF